jgi:DNA-directed RNA polymerase subunit H (RpoH/RPB5)
MHRKKTTKVVHTDQRKECIIYSFADTSKIICFVHAIKKSEILSILDWCPDNPHIMITGPNISRPALVLATQNHIEYVNDDLYLIDRMRSNLLPTYTIMTPDEIQTMETTHKCSRTHWPILKTNDPVAQYLGLGEGTCLFVRDRHGVLNIRHVV